MGSFRISPLLTIPFCDSRLFQRLDEAEIEYLKALYSRNVIKLGEHSLKQNIGVSQGSIIPSALSDINNTLFSGQLWKAQKIIIVSIERERERERRASSIGKAQEQREEIWWTPSHELLSPVFNKDGKLSTLLVFSKTLGDYFGYGLSAVKPTWPAFITKIRHSLGLDKRNKKPWASCADRMLLWHYFTAQAFMLCMIYLEEILLAETVFVVGSFNAIDLELEKASILYLDSQAIENLEVIDLWYLSTISGDYSLWLYW